MLEFFSEDVGTQIMDVSASTRMFQQSIIVAQDQNKSGILSLLSQAEEETARSPQRTAPQTTRPTSRTEGRYTQ